MGRNYTIGANIYKKSSASAPAAKIKKLKLKRLELIGQSNPFLKKPIDLELSENFKINISDDDFVYSLKNRSSNFTMRYDNYFGEPLKTSELVNKIMSLNSCEFDENYVLSVQRVKFKFEQNPFKIFSNQAKYDREWHSTIKSELIEAFSWQILRNIYESTEN